jgi:predicted lipoprotein with Yx(FWY)xxD motif
MHRRSLTGIAGLAAVPVVALALASCGSSGSSSSATTTPPASTAGSGAPQTTVDAGSTNLGSILVDSQGRTLYLFLADSGTTSACTGSCATAWPPVRATAQPTAGNGINASLLGTTPRSDGDPQVTYNGHPLYTFVKDTSAGQTNGEGVNAFGAPWYALSPAGDQVTGAPAAAATPSSGSSTPSSGGY